MIEVRSAKLGSLPLARGTVPQGQDVELPRGITPACAGNSEHRRRGRYTLWDHPRLRGEQRKRPRFARRCIGSPPLARGTARSLPGPNRSTGITPACAGNRQTIDTDDAPSEDHPRLRGEQPSWARSTSRAQGSPPLARGTDFGGRYIGDKSGITPACAGNSEPAIKTTSSAKDHPRLRGEQNIQLIKCIYNLGSPPLARGTDNCCTKTPNILRITPACAGNSEIFILNETDVWDHPRLRGEQVML